MGPSEKSFNQVKAILGKLDRNIDQLRERRTNKVPAPVPTVAPVDAGRSASPALLKPVEPVRSVPNSQYGRATPIPPKNA